MNTGVEYRYTDADNYKQSRRLVVAGVLDPADVAPHLDSEGYFLAGQVGLPQLQLAFSSPSPDAEHSWCRFDTAEDDLPTDSAARVAALATALTPTAEPAEEGYTAAALAAAFAAAGRAGWDEDAELAAIQATWRARGFAPETDSSEAPLDATR